MRILVIGGTGFVGLPVLRFRGTHGNSVADVDDRQMNFCLLFCHRFVTLREQVRRRANTYFMPLANRLRKYDRRWHE